MKTQMLISVLAIIMAALTANASVSEFNAMIVESQAAKTELSQKLKKNADVGEISVVPNGKIVIEEPLDNVEQVASPSGRFNLNRKQAIRSNGENMHRVSQELDESGN